MQHDDLVYVGQMVDVAAKIEERAHLASLPSPSVRGLFDEFESPSFPSAAADQE